jgi:hypothetical protein
LISVDELKAARANMYVAQERLNCFPDCGVQINALGGFNMARTAVRDGVLIETGNHLICDLSDGLLSDILHRRVHWNNAEIGCLIRFNRTGPYIPDVHTLMSFFHLPRGT